MEEQRVEEEPVDGQRPEDQRPEEQQPEEQRLEAQPAEQKASRKKAGGLLSSLFVGVVAVGALLAAWICGSTSSLATYENLDYGYTIKYPDGWRVDDDQPDEVIIEPEEGNGQMLVQVLDLGREYSLSDLADMALDASRDRMDDLDELGQRTVELPTGHRGRVIDMTYDNPDDDGGTLRSRLLLVPVDEFVFQVEVALLDRDWDSDFDRTADDIVESLEIEE